MSAKRWLVLVAVVALLALGALAVVFGPNVQRLFEPVTDVFPTGDAGAAGEPY